MSRVCVLTGKRNNVANSVSHSHHKTKRVQKVNIFEKRFFMPSQNRWVRLKVSAQAIRSIEKMGLEEFMRKVGVTA
jgi:large subunit ribosomal protein L28